MPKDKSSLDEEALPGLTKIETIDYRWLLAQSDKANDQQVARLLELKNKLLVANYPCLNQGVDRVDLPHVGSD
jgi:hypothetical protein